VHNVANWRGKEGYDSKINIQLNGVIGSTPAKSELNQTALKMERS
jgi:hypothetical protein